MRRKVFYSFLAFLLSFQMVLSVGTIAFATGNESFNEQEQKESSIGSDETVVYLSDLGWKSAEVGYSSPQKDLDIDGGPITLRTDTNGGTAVYKKGICAHAASKLVFDITGQGVKRFRSYIGVNCGCTTGKCGFTVDIDGTTVKRVEDLAENQVEQFVDVEIPDDAKTLTLFTDNGSDNVQGYDHSVWADAKLICDKNIQSVPKSIDLNADQHVLKIGESTHTSVVGYSVSGAKLDIPSNEITYTSSNEAVAKVANDGTVTGMTDGFTTISCSVIVAEDKTLKESLDFTIGKGESNSSWEMLSPDKSSRALFTLRNGKLSFSAYKNDKMVVDDSPTGLVSDKADFGNKLVFESCSTKEINENYTLYAAKAKNVQNHANETTLNFSRVKDSGGVGSFNYSVVVRAYNEGIALKYKIDGSDPINFSSENTGFQLPTGTNSWVMPYVAPHEQVAQARTNSQMNDERYCMPFLFKTKDGIWGLISEAAWTEQYCGADLVGHPSGLVNVVFSNEQQSDVIATAPFESPWRFLTMGTLSDINETLMPENLSTDVDWNNMKGGKAANLNWLQPGATAWTWLNGDPTNDPNVYKKYIDFAVEMGWKYVLLDEGWQPSGASGSGLHYDGYFPWTDDLLSYAKQKGIGLIAWEHNDDLKQPNGENRIKELAQKGFKGIKADFFNSQSQEYIQFYKRLYRETAQNGMCINIHGSNKSTGERRTYPNALTREGVFGAEQDKFRASDVSAQHNCMLPFTRAAVGPTDYTPLLSYCNSGRRESFSLAHMAALTVVYEGGIPCLADKPDVYHASPAYEFFKKMPGAWDESRCLDGEPGEYANIARRSGDNWYVGIICNTQREAKFKLDFLGEETHYAFIYQDGSALNDIKASVQEVNKDTVMDIPLLKTGGAAIKIVKTLPTQAKSISVDKSELTLQTGDMAGLSATLNPAGTEYTKVNWTSSKPEIATVTNGTITALEPGTTVITASTGVNNDITATCKVTVKRNTKVAVIPEGNWISDASDMPGSATAAGDAPICAIDGKTDTRWTSGKSQDSSIWFTLNMGSKYAFNTINMNCGDGDYPREYKVLISDDGSKWSNPVATGEGKPGTTTITFPRQTAQYIKICSTGSAQAWWSIYELTVSNMLTDKTISSIVDLDPSIKTQKVPNGTPLSLLYLPQTLNTVMDGISGFLVDISKWTSDYNPMVAGTYSFTPVLDSGYVCANGVNLPKIRVTVESPKSTDKTISSFQELNSSVKVQEVANGTSRNSLTLPNSLQATVEGKTETISGINWASSPAYNPTSAGTYTFTAKLPGGYVPGNKINMPTITIIVAASENNNSNNSSNNHSSSNNSSNSATTPSTMTVTQNGNGGTAATVTTQPDTAPVVTGNKSNVKVTIPADVASVIFSATAEKPAEVKVSAPTASLVEQLKNTAVTTVDLTVSVPSVVANNTNANAKVSINVEPAVLQAAKDAKKDVTVEVVNSATGSMAYSWTFTGSNLTNSAASLTNVNLAITVEPAKNDTAAAAVTAGNTSDRKPTGVVLNFAHSGLLPATASVRVYVGNQPGVTPFSKMYLYYFNKVTNTLEQLPQSEYTIDALGFVTVPIAHCSEYVLLPKPAVNAYAVKSDTWTTVGIKNGKTYTYAMTVSGKVVPSFTVGNGKAFAVTVKRYGNKYYVMIRATGAAGTMTAVYSTLPKQKPVIMGYAAIAK